MFVLCSSPSASHANILHPARVYLEIPPVLYLLNLSLDPQSNDISLILPALTSQLHW